jgi:hypothetical protein
MNLGVTGSQLISNISGAVRGVVINHQNINLGGMVANGGDLPRQRLPLVVGGDNY